MVSEEQNSEMELASEVIPVPQVQPVVQEAPQVQKDANKEENVISNRKPRKRKKILYGAIRQQMEFYFGDSNLSKDRFLAECIRQDPYVDIEIFLRFNKIRNMTTDVEKIVRSLRDSTMLKLSDDQTKVCRVTPIQEKTNFDECTIYVQNLPAHADHDWVREWFSKYGPIAYVSIPKFKSNNKIKGFAFVEFETPEDAEKCLKVLRAKGFELPSHEATTDLLSIQTFEQEGNNEIDCDKDEFKTVIEDSKESKTKKKKIHLNKPENVEYSTTKSDDQSDSTKAKKRKSIDSSDKDSSACQIDLTAEHEGKRCKKRKKNLSPENDCKTENLEKQDVKDEKEDESGNPIKNHDVNETDNDNENTKEDGEETTEKKKKKKRKRKHPKEFENLETPETCLQVLSKKDWKKLRNRYLNLQRKKMKELKQHMRRAQWNQYDRYSKTIENEEATSIKKQNPASNLEFVPGVIIKVELNQSCVDPKGFKAELKNTNNQIKYIDIKEGSNEAFVRCDSADAAKELLQKTNEEKCFKLLIGDDEKAYWNKIRQDREEKINNKIRSNVRGRSKLLKKAEKALGKHIKFDEM